MALSFNGTSIPGKALPFRREARATQLKRTHFFGVNGESEIVGRTGGRQIIVPYWIFDANGRFPNIRTLEGFIDGTLNGTLALTNGALVIDPTDINAPVFREVTFEGCHVRDEPGIVLD